MAKVTKTDISAQPNLELKDKIISSIEKNKSKIFEIIGVNGSGKTQLLNNIWLSFSENEKYKNKVVYIRSEPSVMDDMKEGKKTVHTAYDDLFNLLTSLLNQSTDGTSAAGSAPQLSLQEQFKNLCKAVNDKFNQLLPSSETGDTKIKPFFDKLFVNIDSSRSLNEFIKTFCLNNDINKEVKTYSTGEKIFYFLIYCLCLLEHLNNDKQGYIFIIDEPERYLHASFINLLCKKIMNISKNNTFIIATHSEKILFNLNRCSWAKQMFYLYVDSANYKNIEININLISKQFFDKFISIFFNEHLIICEGMSDYNVLTNWLMDEKVNPNFFFSVIPFNGKGNLVKFLQWVKTLQPIEQLIKKIYIVYDKDSTKPESEKHNQLINDFASYKQLFSENGIEEFFSGINKTQLSNNLYSVSDLEQYLTEDGKKKKQDFIENINKWDHDQNSNH